MIKKLQVRIPKCRGTEAGTEARLVHIKTK
jgi:hypothetical protein